MKKNYKKYLLVVGVLCLAGFGIYKIYPTKKDVSRFSKVFVTKGDLHKTISSTATAKPQNRVEIKPPISGRIDEILVNEGDYVKKGQILAWMSSSERASLLDSARIKGAAELKHWEELYRPTPIISSIAGTVIARSMEAGQTISNGEALLVLSDRLMFEVLVDETDIGLVKQGQSVEIEMDAYPGKPFKAHVNHIAYEAQIVSNVRMYAVSVIPEVMPSFVRSGMSASVTFVIESKEDILLLPSDAIQTRSGKTFVLVSSDDPKKPERVSIQTGITDGKMTEILSGLSEGDQILVRQFQFQSNKSSQGSSPFMPQRGSGRRSSR